MIGPLALAASLAVPAVPGPALPVASHAWVYGTRRTTSVLRFRGTLRAVENLESWEPPADSDADRLVAGQGVHSCAYSLAGRPALRFAVKIFVERVEPNQDIQQGALLNLAVESLTESIGADAAVGATKDLELLTEHSDGVFCGFDDLRPSSSAAQPFDGHLAVGRTFRIPVQWDAAKKVTVPSEELEVPMHYGGSIEWVNPQAVRELGPDRPEGWWVVEVRSAEAESLGSNQLPQYWVTYRCTFKALEPCQACAAPK